MALPPLVTPALKEGFARPLDIPHSPATVADKVIAETIEKTAENEAKQLQDQKRMELEAFLEARQAEYVRHKAEAIDRDARAKAWLDDHHVGIGYLDAVLSNQSKAKVKDDLKDFIPVDLAETYQQAKQSSEEAAREKQLLLLEAEADVREAELQKERRKIALETEMKLHTLKYLEADYKGLSTSSDIQPYFQALGQRYIQEAEDLGVDGSELSITPGSTSILTGSMSTRSSKSSDASSYTGHGSLSHEVMTDAPVMVTTCDDGTERRGPPIPIEVYLNSENIRIRKVMAKELQSQTTRTTTVLMRPNATKNAVACTPDPSVKADGETDTSSQGDSADEEGKDETDDDLVSVISDDVSVVPDDVSDAGSDDSLKSDVTKVTI
jgi:hypothetical protein